MKVINATRTYLPPLSEYDRYLKKIWRNGRVTNNGELVQELEKKLKKYLGVKHLFLVNNGTTALQIAIKALDLKGEIITTPFSFVATTASIAWIGCKPVFVDIDPKTLTIDADKIKNAITKNTEGILATHIYGIPCNVEKIKEIARKYKLKVIYDNAQGFDALYKGKSLASYGDISILSFHATKIFHTIEGGALVTADDKLAHKILYIRNHGIKDEESFWGLGINGKQSELHAAMGLCILPKVKKNIAERKKISKWYDVHLLKEIESLQKPVIPLKTKYNYAYYPILFPIQKMLLKAKELLNKKQIFPRRYFYPALSSLKYVQKSSTSVADDVSKRVLCLPLHQGLTKKEVKQISSLIVKSCQTK